MKKPKTFLTMSVPFDQIVRAPHRCAWKGCTETTVITDAPPKDWRWLALWWDRSDGHPNPFKPGVRLDRDAILCPVHARLLHDELLEDIGQQLDQTKGTA